MLSSYCGSDSFSKSHERGKHLLLSWTIQGEKKSEFLHNADIFVGKFLQHQKKELLLFWGLFWVGFVLFYFFAFSTLWNASNYFS